MSAHYVMFFAAPGSPQWLHNCYCASQNEQGCQNCQHFYLSIFSKKSFARLLFDMPSTNPECFTPIGLAIHNAHNCIFQPFGKPSPEPLALIINQLSVNLLSVSVHPNVFGHIFSKSISVSVNPLPSDKWQLIGMDYFTPPAHWR